MEASKFRRLTGVTPAVFAQMREAALAGEPPSSHPAGGDRRGPRPKLGIEDRLLVLLLYYREYRTFAHVGASFRVSEAQTWRDRTSILLPQSQRDLIDKVAALGKPFVVVLTNGSALSFDTGKPNAILEAWYYGEQGGNAVAEALLGDYNPGGRLPVTFYQSDADLPGFTDYSMVNRTYRYFKGKPLYAFGYGLSYTTFSEDHLALSAAEAKCGDMLELSVVVKNTGSRAGDDVVELYARAVKPPVSMPQQWLVGFQRVSLTPGETKTVTIPVRVESLRHYDETLKSYVVDPGDYELRVGPSSDHLPATASLNILK